MATSLGSTTIAAVIPASDLERAKRFYSDQLGLTATLENQDGIFYECGNGSYFFLYPAQGPASGQHTQAAWIVDDIGSVMDDLRSRGVSFEEYDIPGVHTEGGVMTTPTGKGAFFKDSEGNILSVIAPSHDIRSQLGR
jgi:predicted enzyme related to lactoylglutathione lyase